MNDPLIPIVSTELPFTVQPKIRGVDMDFSDESLVDKHNPDFSVKGWFLFKFLYKVYSSSVFCAAKYRGGVRRTEGLKKRSKGNGLGCNLLPCRVLWHYGVLCYPYRGDTEETIVSKERGWKRHQSVYIGYIPFLLPCPVALRGVAKQHRDKRLLFNPLPLCFR